MARVEVVGSPGILGFSSIPVPSDPDGAYQTGALLLRVFGWVTFALTILGGLALVFGSFIVGTFGAWFASGPWWTGWWGWAAGWAFLFAFFFLLLVALVFIVVGVVLMRWTSTIVALWAQKDRRALSHMFALGIVLLVYALFQLASAISSVTQGHTGTLVDPTLLGALGFGVGFLALANRDDVKAAFA